MHDIGITRKDILKVNIADAEETLFFQLLACRVMGQWLVAGVDWKSLQPLYKFGCGGNDQYIIKE